MIGLRHEEGLGRNNLRHDRTAPLTGGVEFRDLVFGTRTLLLRMKKDRRAVLSPDIGPLLVERRRIMCREEDVEQIVERDDLRVELDLYDFRMSAVAAANLLVSRVGRLTAAVARLHCRDAAQLLEHRFDTPEATCSQRGQLASRFDGCVVDTNDFGLS